MSMSRHLTERPHGRSTGKCQRPDGQDSRRAEPDSRADDADSCYEERTPLPRRLHHPQQPQSPPTRHRHPRRRKRPQPLLMVCETGRGRANFHTTAGTLPILTTTLERALAGPLTGCKLTDPARRNPCNCSDLRGNEQPAAFQEGVKAPGPPGSNPTPSFGGFGLKPRRNWGCSCFDEVSDTS